MKRIYTILLPLLLAAALCFSSCGMRYALEPMGPGGEDVFDPIDMNAIKEPDLIDYEVSRYLYDELNEKGKQAYRRIYNTISEQPAKIRIPAMTQDELSEVFLALKYDNPHILCLKNSYTYYYAGSDFYILPEYNDTAANCQSMTEELIAAARSVCDSMPIGLGTYDKELYLHDRLLTLVSYDTCEQSDTAYGALVNRRAACGGYALACKLLFDMAGIKSVAVTGKTTDDEGVILPHMWLAVNVNKEWYFVDPTWDDPVNKNGMQTVRHTYFNVNAEELSFTHSDFTPPACVHCDAEAEDYYSRSGLYCTAQDWRDIVTAKLADAGRMPIHLEFRFADAGGLQDASDSLFENGELGRLVAESVPGGDDGPIISHSLDEDRSVIHIYIRENTEET